MKQSKIIINYNGITGGVKADYKFLNISKEVLKNNLNYICGKDINNNIIIEKKNEKNAYCLNKDLLNYVNAAVDLKIAENYKIHNINLNNSSLSNDNNNDIKVSRSIYQLEEINLLQNGAYAQ